MYSDLQDGKKGETLTCAPSPDEMFYVSRCSDSKVTVGGACAKCIIGTTLACTALIDFVPSVPFLLLTEVSFCYFYWFRGL